MAKKKKSKTKKVKQDKSTTGEKKSKPEDRFRIQNRQRKDREADSAKSIVLKQARQTRRFLTKQARRQDRAEQKARKRSEAKTLDSAPPLARQGSGGMSDLVASFAGMDTSSSTPRRGERARTPSLELLDSIANQR